MSCGHKEAMNCPLTFELSLEGRRICQVKNGSYKKQVPPGALSSKCKEAQELDRKGHVC